MSEALKKMVKKTYTEVLKSGPGCGCGPTCGTPTDRWTLSEDYNPIKGYKAEADYGLGCGLPTEHAYIKQGDIVLDLGSGAGNDVFIARDLVGKNGKVIGVDMTEAMIEKANQNKQKLGFNNIEFVLGEIENLPINENSINVVVSNCVLNLVPNKNKAYAEVHRVLKPNGHFSMSDIVIDGNLPEGIKQAAEMYAGCISGAMQKEDYLNTIKNAGFNNIRITKERKIEVPDSILLQYVNKEELEQYKATNHSIISLGVYAEK